MIQRIKQVACAACLVAAVASNVQAAYTSTLTASASGGYSGLGFGNDNLNSAPMSLNGAATTNLHGINITNSAGSVHNNHGLTNVNVPAGTFGLLGSSHGTVNWPSDGYTTTESAGASANFNEYLNVISPNNSLANGTAVTLTFSIQVAYVGTASHTVPYNVFAAQNDYAQYLVGLGAGAGNTVGFSPPQGQVSSFYMDSNQNKTYHATYDAAGTALGIFNNGTGHVDFTIAARIGDTIQFSLNPTLSVFAYNRPWNQDGFHVYPVTSDAFAQLGVAWGVSASAGAGAHGLFTPTSLAIVDATSGLAAPDSSNATFDNAYNAMPIPEPSTFAVLGLIGIGAMRRRR
jgi:hypothetical protein